MTPTFSSQPRSFAADIPRTIGVLIPTYRRANDLLRCLSALKTQERPPDDVLLIVRTEDRETPDRVRSFPPDDLRIRMLTTDVPGTVHAHNLGIENCSTDILAMIDDDTEPQPQWLRIILEHFQNDPTLGGLGGRDRCFEGSAFIDERRAPVGKMQWFGRCIGNHHTGYGPIRECDILKGANMSFRAAALEHARCDTRLRGTGAQPNEDVSLALAVQRQGWKIAYDPAALVHHFPGAREEVRHYCGQAKVKNAEEYKVFAYNEVVGIWDSLTPLRKIAFVLWSALVGTRICPGLVQAFRFTPSLRLQSWYRFYLAQQAKFEAVYDLPWRSTSRLPARR
jgi:GT2 family glycosyltransferase